MIIAHSLDRGSSKKWKAQSFQALMKPNKNSKLRQPVEIAPDLQQPQNGGKNANHLELLRKRRWNWIPQWFLAFSRRNENAGLYDRPSWKCFPNHFKGLHKRLKLNGFHGDKFCQSVTIFVTSKCLEFLRKPKQVTNFVTGRPSQIFTNGKRQW